MPPIVHQWVVFSTSSPSCLLPRCLLRIRGWCRARRPLSRDRRRRRRRRRRACRRSRRRTSRDARLPRLGGELDAAAAAAGAVPFLFAFAHAAVVPDALAGPFAVGPERVQTGAADGEHVRRGGGEVGEGRGGFFEPVEVAVVAGGGGDDDAGMVERGAVGARIRVCRRLRRIRGRPTSWRSRWRAARPRLPRRFEVRVGRRVGLDERDVAVVADGVGGLDVKRDLDGPAFRFLLFEAGFLALFFLQLGFPRFAAFAERFLGFQARLGLREGQVGGFAVLVDLREAFVRGRAFRETEFFAVGLEVRFGVEVVVRVDECDRLFWRGGRRFVG